MNLLCKKTGIVVFVCRSLALGAAFCLASTSTAQVADSIYNRTSYYSETTATSDDVQRLPVPAEEVESGSRFVLVGGKVFDGSGSAPRNATVLVEGKRILAVLSNEARQWPSDTVVYDVTGKTVLPGLIDLHTHLSYIEEVGLPSELSDENQVDATLRALNRMQIYLRSGVTSVRDLASHGSVPFVLKRWQARGRIVGPRIFPAGQLIVGRGGHGTENFGLTTAPDYPDAAVLEASGPDEWRDAVRRQFKWGADVIKLASHYSQEEINAAVEEAHALGLPVTVDAETRYIDMAIEAGVDTIEHPLPRSEEAIKLMAERGISSVPTLVPYQYIMRLSGGYYGSTSRRFTLNEETIAGMLKKLRRAGVKIGVGTDLVGDWSKYMPFAYIDELKNLMAAGFSEGEALSAATKINAEILRMDDRIGSIAPNMLADMIVVDGDPYEDIDSLAKIDLIFVNGRLVAKEGVILQPVELSVEPPAS